MKKDDNRFAGLGAQALSEAERESVVQLALQVMAQQVADGPVMTGEADAARYLRLKAGGQRARGVRLPVPDDEEPSHPRRSELFYGIDRPQLAVYPRVILQKALEHNASALICYHNHPSGTARAERERHAGDQAAPGISSDEIDVRLLDHIVVSRTETVSMAARGLI